jgi:twitching motility protein PilU
MNNAARKHDDVSPSSETTPTSGVFSAATPRVRELDRFMDHMLKINASDLYITAESPPMFRAEGAGMKGRKALTAPEIDEMVDQFLTPSQKTEFKRTHELNIAVGRGEGRYRVNVFRQRGATGLVIRLIRTKIRTLDELGYPTVMKDIAMSRRGLVLVVGGTGSGKSTALAALLDHRNAAEAGHIITIEDPIEFVHEHKSAIITQREVGVDTISVEMALKSALRQAPDVILIGEIRDVRTMDAALGFAETGHLCVSTLHANNANEAIERVLNFFPPARHPEIRSQLGVNLRAVVSQRLVPTVDGKRASALEIMLDTPRVRQLVKRGEFDALKDAMEQSAPEGCRTFDASLFELFSAGRISEAEALKASDSPNDVRLRIDRFQATGGAARDDEPALRLVPDPLLDRGH